MANDYEDHNSDLQLVKFDPASNAPERDHTTTALEVFELRGAPEVGLHFCTRLLYSLTNALQLVVPRDPEVLYSNDAPIPLTDVGSVDFQDPDPTIKKRSSRNLIRTILGIVLGSVIVGVGLGAGLGITSKRSSASTVPTTSSLPSR